METKRIYGAWITPKNEVVYVFDVMGHESAGAKILNLESRPQKWTRKFSVYGILFRLGYIRVIFEDDNHLVEYNGNRQYKSRILKEWITSAICINTVSHERIYSAEF